MTTDQKGAIAEAGYSLAAIKLGLDVYRPLAEGGRCDLILRFGHELLRVQCKWASLVNDVGDRPLFDVPRERGTAYRTTTYTPTEVDAIAAYCAELDRCFLIPIERAANGSSDRAARRADEETTSAGGINWADDFDFAATLRRHQGAVAQLGERLAGSQ